MLRRVPSPVTLKTHIPDRNKNMIMNFDKTTITITRIAITTRAYIAPLQHSSLSHFTSAFALNNQLLTKQHMIFAKELSGISNIVLIVENKFVLTT